MYRIKNAGRVAKVEKRKKRMPADNRASIRLLQEQLVRRGQEAKRFRGDRGYPEAYPTKKESRRGEA